MSNEEQYAQISNFSDSLDTAERLSDIFEQDSRRFPHLFTEEQEVSVL